MTKQQRRSSAKSTKPAAAATPRARSTPEAEPPTASPAPPQPVASTQPHRRSSYFEAVAVYERGLEALQRHEYRAAAGLFQSVLTQYAEEKELHERVRLYLNICERHAAPQEPGPQTLEERLFASTLSLNGGRYDEAIQLLRLVRDEDPDNDHALYMLAVAHAQRGEHAEAIAHLERAIALNPENRGLARHDPDLEPIREDEAFRMALETPATASKASLAPPRRPIRTRSAR